MQLKPDGFYSLNGYGKYHHQGQCAMGYFKDHYLNGWGTVHRADGTIREGYHINNKLNGVGYLRKTENTKIEGEFRNGKLKGKGRIIEIDEKDKELNSG